MTFETSIIRSGHPTLRKVAKDVPHGQDVNLLVSTMWHAMIRERGIGLAANQVNALYRVIVVCIDGLNLKIINPRITKRYGGKIKTEEQCLSFPGAKTTVPRYKQIIVEGFDLNWKPLRQKLKGTAAYCLQHEVDHLNGINIVP